ncbi:MAG: hypothetical protein ACYC6Y_02865 [Thermoguttaceae bacterium]
MQVPVNIPTAFSIREENEFFPIQHLLDRMNPKLMVHRLGTGRHVHGGPTVLWGLVYLDGQQPTPDEIEAALKAAGYDFEHNGPVGALSFWGD